MWMTCALLTALSLSPAQAGGLQLTNVRATSGLLGPPRPDNKVLPGDLFLVAFDIDGLTVDDQGKVEYSLEVEFKNAEGKVQLQNKADKIEAYLPLGGTRLPAEAHAEVGTSTPAGKYSINVTVVDLKAKAAEKKAFSKEFEVVPPTFGIVRTQLTYEGTGVPAPAGGVVGQVLAFNCLVMGFKRDDGTKQPNLSVEIKIVDQSGAPTTKKPMAQTFNNVPGAANYLDLHLPLELNRTGKFTMEVKITDLAAGNKTTALQIPIAVQDAPK